MSLINIGGDANDSSYRYKMPRLQTKIEGRGNGIKTVLPNMVEVAKALHCPPSYPTKFFGIELGAQSTFKKKDERAIVNGAHQTGDMQTALGKFIDIFILCPTCKLPELNMAVKKSGIKIDCAACGHNGPLATSHKLTTYIINHPPTGKKGKSKGGKKDKKSKRQSKQPAEESNKDDEKSAKESKDDAEVEWFTDTSKAAQKKRMQEEIAGMEENGNPEVEKILAEARAANKEDAPTTVLKVFLASKDRDVNAITSELRRLQLSRGLDDVQRVKVLLESIIDCSDAKTVHTQFASKAELLQKFVNDKAQGTTLINCLEELCGVTHPKLIVRIPHILQALYEADVLDEDTIVAWHCSPPDSSWLVNNEVAAETRAKADPLVKWFEEAESETDSDEE